MIRRLTAETRLHTSHPMGVDGRTYHGEGETLEEARDAIMAQTRDDETIAQVYDTDTREILFDTLHDYIVD